jgi:hypothetical protein
MGTASGFLLLRRDAHRREARREMADAAQPTADEKKSRGLGSYVLWAFVAVMVYVLSSGPVIGFYGRQNWYRGQFISINPGGSLSWRHIYAPLEAAYNRTLLHRPLGMYWHLWCPDVWNKDGDIIIRWI